MVNACSVVGGSDDEYIYVLKSLPTRGILTLNGGVLGVNDTYTQADINSGNLVYRHTKLENTTSSYVNDSWTFYAKGFVDGFPAMTCTNCGIECLPSPEIPRSADGIYTMPVRIKVVPAPTIDVNTGITVKEGETACFTTAILHAINKFSDGTDAFLPETLKFTTVTPPTHGNVPTVDNLTQNLIPTICYESVPGWDGTTSWGLKVCNDAGKCTNLAVSITVIGFPAPTIYESGNLTLPCDITSITITQDHLLAGNQDSTSDQIAYTFEQPENGSLNRLTFTQNDIDNGLITYTKDNGINATVDIPYTVCNQMGKCVTSTFSLTSYKHPCVSIETANCADSTCGVTKFTCDGVEHTDTSDTFLGRSYIQGDVQPIHGFRIDTVTNKSSSCCVSIWLTDGLTEHWTGGGIRFKWGHSGITDSRVQTSGHGVWKDNAATICVANTLSSMNVVWGAYVDIELDGTLVPGVYYINIGCDTTSSTQWRYRLEIKPPNPTTDPDPTPTPNPTPTPDPDPPPPESTGCLTIRFTTNNHAGWTNISTNSSGSFTGTVLLNYYINSSGCSNGYCGDPFKLQFSGATVIDAQCSPIDNIWTGESGGGLCRSSGSTGQVKIELHGSKGSSITFSVLAADPVKRGDSIKINFI